MVVAEFEAETVLYVKHLGSKYVERQCKIPNFLDNLETNTGKTFECPPT